MHTIWNERLRVLNKLTLESENTWIAPLPADIVYDGATYTPSIRRQDWGHVAWRLQ